jgi:hypothetical protein
LISPKEPGINTYGEAIPCDGVIALVLMRKGGEECWLERERRGRDEAEVSRCITRNHPALFCFH